MLIGVRYATTVLAVAGLSMPAGEAAVRREQVQFLRGYEGHAFVMNTDGSAQHRSPLPSYGYWSPDGRRVAYAAAQAALETG